jgi:aerobic-type carbon monoxide dehydrogenase small subunit (CoxS/CutS family)
MTEGTRAYGRPQRKVFADRATVQLELNGSQVTVDVPVRLTLADMLRDRLGLTGTHLGCEHGICGACTVMLDGKPVRSCLVLAVQADGAAVRTVEGLAEGEALHPLQRAFHEHHALQCGFCTPGFLMLATGLLENEPRATEERVREVLSSNLCRCTGYTPILAAVLAAQRELTS